uniref:Uncharacterized protein n=1 Tax=Ananas comosus var. bracteatus TaxID=296719 RepID=A0A6V7Q5U5_ANACO|nr:unnamed protein product [Ananas comosus var. bracteatus]
MGGNEARLLPTVADWPAFGDRFRVRAEPGSVCRGSPIASVDEQSESVTNASFGPGGSSSSLGWPYPLGTMSIVLIPRCFGGFQRHKVDIVLRRCYRGVMSSLMASITPD